MSCITQFLREVVHDKKLIIWWFDVNFYSFSLESFNFGLIKSSIIRFTLVLIFNIVCNIYNVDFVVYTKCFIKCRSTSMKRAKAAVRNPIELCDVHYYLHLLPHLYAHPSIHVLEICQMNMFNKIKIGYGEEYVLMKPEIKFLFIC